MNCYIYSDDFDIEEWNGIKNQKERRSIQEETVETELPTTFKTSTSTVVSAPTVPPILSEGIELPYESKLAIFGRKFIGMKFTSSKYLHERLDGLTRPFCKRF